MSSFSSSSPVSPLSSQRNPNSPAASESSPLPFIIPELFPPPVSSTNHKQQHHFLMQSTKNYRLPNPSSPLHNLPNTHRPNPQNHIKDEAFWSPAFWIRRNKPKDDTLEADLRRSSNIRPGIGKCLVSGGGSELGIRVRSIAGKLLGTNCFCRVKGEDPLEWCGKLRGGVVRERKADQEVEDGVVAAICLCRCCRSVLLDVGK